MSIPTVSGTASESAVSHRLLPRSQGRASLFRRAHPLTEHFKSPLPDAAGIRPGSLCPRRAWNNARAIEIELLFNRATAAWVKDQTCGIPARSLPHWKMAGSRWFWKSATRKNSSAGFCTSVQEFKSLVQIRCDQRLEKEPKENSHAIRDRPRHADDSERLYFRRRDPPGSKSRGR